MKLDEAALEQATGPLNKLLGVRLVSATEAEVVAEVDVTQDLHQPFGLVHGGVYCAMIETVTSIGAFVLAGTQTRVVGLTNRTSFLRAVRDGKLRAVATPVSRESPHQTWAATITDGNGKLIADGTVDLLELGG